MAQVANLAAEAHDVRFVRDTANRDPDRGAHVAGDNAFRKAVHLLLVDSERVAVVRDAPTEEYTWDRGPSHCIAIMKSASHSEVVDKVHEKIPTGTTVSAIYGAP